MCKIDELKPGREIDKLIAEKVMGWTKSKNPFGDAAVIVCCDVDWWWINPSGKPKCSNDYAHGWIPPQYSTHIKDAFQIVDYLLEYAHDFELQWLGATYGWWCKISGECAKARTPEMAICKAALKTVEKKDVQKQ